MRITNLVSSTRQINAEINHLSLNALQQSSDAPSNDEFASLHRRTLALVERTEKLCKKQGGLPEDLPTPSFRAYQWLKFLSQPDKLALHIAATEAFYRILLDLFPRLKLKTLPKKIQIDCYHSSYLFRNRQKEGKVYLEINEGFINAPEKIKEAILKAALQRRTAARLRTIKAFTTTPEYAQIHASLQNNAGANKLAGNGRVYNLVDIFARINRQYFESQLEQPRLVWSARKSIRRLGTYQPDADTITISKRLDSRDIPEYLVEYVMYHEMLHKKIGLKEVNGRRYAHTKAFRDAEKQFNQYKEAEAFIKKLNQSI